MVLVKTSMFSCTIGKNSFFVMLLFFFFYAFCESE